MALHRRNPRREAADSGDVAVARSDDWLRRFLLLGGCEALIEALAFLREIKQQFVWRKSCAILLVQLSAQFDEALGAHHASYRDEERTRRR